MIHARGTATLPIITFAISLKNLNSVKTANDYLSVTSLASQISLNGFGVLQGSTDHWFVKPLVFIRTFEASLSETYQR